MNTKPRLNIPMMLSLNKETVDILESLVDSKIYEDKSKAAKAAILGLSKLVKIKEEINNFVQINSPLEYVNFFLKIKEIVKDV